MNTTQFATCKCQHCSGKIEFETEHRGEAVECPHCKMDTRLFVPPPSFKPNEPGLTYREPKGIPARSVRWRWIGFGSAAALVLAVVALVFSSTTTDWESFPETVLGVCGLAIAIALYFTPAHIGRHKRNHQAILVLNIFLGWTFIGWVVALVWATTTDDSSI